MYPCASCRQARGADGLRQTPLLFSSVNNHPEVKNEKRSAQYGKCAALDSLSKACWKASHLSTSTRRANHRISMVARLPQIRPSPKTRTLAAPEVPRVSEVVCTAGDRMHPATPCGDRAHEKINSFIIQNLASSSSSSAEFALFLAFLLRLGI